MSKYLLEIATANYSSTAAAVAGGADRIELCSALSEGGLTPSQGYLVQCRKDFSLPLFPIIRPRGGDFLYSAEEFQLMKADVIFCRQVGMDGIVVGFLQRDGAIDKDRTRAIVELAHPMQVTFHRAFDRCRDPLQSLEQIIDAGCRRVLTSGQKPKAMDGVELIAALVEKAKDRIIILPGSGVRKTNIAHLAKLTGAVEFHSSLSEKSASSMLFVHPDFATETGDYTLDTVSAAEVRSLRQALAAETKTQ